MAQPILPKTRCNGQLGTGVSNSCVALKRACWGASLEALGKIFQIEEIFKWHLDLKMSIPLFFARINPCYSCSSDSYTSLEGESAVKTKCFFFCQKHENEILGKKNIFRATLGTLLRDLPTCLEPHLIRRILTSSPSFRPAIAHLHSISVSWDKISHRGTTFGFGPKNPQRTPLLETPSQNFWVNSVLKRS